MSCEENSWGTVTGRVFWKGAAKPMTRTTVLNLSINQITHGAWKTANFQAPPLTILICYVWRVAGCLLQYPFPEFHLGKQYIQLGKRKAYALSGVAQWIECWPGNQGVAGSIPGQGTWLGCGPGPLWGHVRGNHTLMFLSLSLPYFPSV